MSELRQDTSAGAVRAPEASPRGGQPAAQLWRPTEPQTWDVIAGNCRDTIRQLPDNSVQCVVTSPPYLYQRGYNLADTVYGGDPRCEHDFPVAAPTSTPETVGNKGIRRLEMQRGKAGATCSRCGAWRGTLGLEEDPHDYLMHLIKIFREIHPKLHEMGTIWLNIGDSYGRGDENSWYAKAKDQMLVPFRLAIALQEVGWYVRSTVIWHKTVIGLEDVTDRPVQSHEYVFMLTKSPVYFYDHYAVVQPAKAGSGTAAMDRNTDWLKSGELPAWVLRHEYRKRRTVWTLNPDLVYGPHTATFPRALAELCILASTPSAGVCSVCAAPLMRNVEPSLNLKEHRAKARADRLARGNTAQGSQLSWEELAKIRAANPDIDRGWLKTCTCSSPTRPATVMDPFSGSGTTGAVSLALGRSYVGFELSPEQVQISRDRLAKVMESRA